MKTLLILVSCLLICSLASCEYDTDRRQLAYIDTIMETNPDSALSLISNISPGELSSDNLAYYSLLFTQAQFKNYIQVSSDSLIQFAYGKYCNSSSKDLRKRACFYNSRVALNAGRFPAAMGDAVVAYELAKEADDPYWMAKTAELISDIFNDTYNYEQAEIYEKQAIDCYLKAGKIANHRYALCDLAMNYRNDNRPKEAMFIVDSLYNVVGKELPIDSALLDYISWVYVANLFDYEKNDSVDKVIGKIASDFGANELLIEKSILSSFHAGEDSMDIGRDNILDESLEKAKNIRDSAKILYAVYQHQLLNENYKRAALLGDSLIILQSMIASDMLKESVTGVQRDFYTSEAVRYEQKTKFLLFILIGILIVAIVFITLIYRIYHLKIIAKNTEIEAWYSEVKLKKEQANMILNENSLLLSQLRKKVKKVETLTSELNNNSYMIDSLRKELEDKSNRELKYASLVEDLFTEQWSTLNKLFDRYFEMGDTEIGRTTIFNEIKHEIESLRKPKNLHQIEKTVDKHLGSIMSLLRSECDFLDEKEFVYMSLIYAGFSVRSVCLLIDIKYRKFYSYRTHILKEIAKSEAPHKDLFISKFK